MTEVCDLPALPGPACGLEWRVLNIGDNTELAALFSRIEIVDNPQYRTTAEETGELFRAADSIAVGAFDAGQTLRTFGVARISVTEKHQVACIGGVDPLYRGQGLGRIVLNWQTNAACALLRPRDLPADARPNVVVHVDSDKTQLIAHLEEMDFVWVRSFVELRASLAKEVELADPGRYLEILPWDPELEDTVRRVSNRITAESWGRLPADMEEWMAGRAFFAPEWSFIARDRSGDRAPVIGFILCSRYEQDWDVLGRTEGYVDFLGVDSGWANTDVADALLTHAMAAMAADGMDCAAAGTAGANDSSALDLFESHGFEVVSGSAMYGKDLTDRSKERPREQRSKNRERPRKLRGRRASGQQR